MPRRKLFNPDSKEPFKFSRSKLEIFIQCPRCFYLDLRLGISRPPGFPFNLNSAVDTLLKAEFDEYRLLEQPHPIMQKYNIDAIPFKHESMDKWRHNFSGVETIHNKSNIKLFGAVDDVWVNKKGDLYVVDYKSTSKNDEVNIDADWQRSYKNQIEIYQWLLEQNGFRVSPTGYFVYANAIKQKEGCEAFGDCLEFKTKVIEYKGDNSWVDDKLVAAKECLKNDKIPEKSDECEYCNYREGAGNAFKDFLSGSSKTR